MGHDPKKLAYWSEHYRMWHDSGLSQRAYCQQKSLSLSSFDHWRRRVKEAANGVATATPSPQPPQEKLTLLPVRIGGNVGDIVLRSPAGWQVTLPAALEPSMLMQLLSHLP